MSDQASQQVFSSTSSLSLVETRELRHRLARPNSLLEPDPLPNEPIKKPKRRRPKQRQGHWLPEENKLYLDFLLKHQDVFRRRDVRKTGRIFRLMEKAVDTRNSLQCRSHHQKMELKYKSFEEIVEYLQKESERSLHTGSQEKQANKNFEINQGEEILSSIDDQQDSLQAEMPRLLEPSYNRLAQSGQLRIHDFRAKIAQNVNSRADSGNSSKSMQIPSTSSQ